MIDWNIGCSGFHYKHWKGKFYPDTIPQRLWFDYYCEHFKTLELNVTFYRFPQLSFLQNWYQKSPANFKFAVKAPKAITHYKKFNDTQRMLTDFYNIVNDGLEDKLGCILFQMPPNYNYTPEKLEKILNGLNPAFNNVLEFRHISWWDKDIIDQLTSRNISFCGMSHPLLPVDVIINTPLFYYRFHGITELYKSSYTTGELQQVVNDIEQSQIVKQAFIYFNNDIDVAAIYNAKEMEGLINNSN